MIVKNIENILQRSRVVSMINGQHHPLSADIPLAEGHNDTAPRLQRAHRVRDAVAELTIKVKYRILDGDACDPAHKRIISLLRGCCTCGS